MSSQQTPHSEEGSLARITVLVAHPSSELYGSDRVLIESVQGLIDASARVVVTLPSNGPLCAELRQRGAHVEFCPAPVLRKSVLKPREFPRFLGRVARGSVAGVRLIRRERPTLVYVNTLTIPLWIGLARILRVRVVCHVHEAEGSASSVVGRSLTFPLLFANRIIANSEFSVRVLSQSFRRLGSRSEVIYNGVPGPESVTPARAALTTPVRVLYVGRLSERKGVDLAIDAIAKLRDRGVLTRLDIVGAVFAGYEWYERQLRDQIVTLGLTDLVTLHGFQSSVWPFLAASDIAVVPSRVDEPFGNTAVEAVLAGRPVVVSETSGLREAARGYACASFVAPGNATALADAIEHTVGSWKTFRAAAHADQVIAAQRHDPRLYGKRVANAVGAALVTARRSRPESIHETVDR